jgi:RNA polymerase sigma factor (sigma-70 family)
MPIRNFNFTYLEYRQDGGYSDKIMQLLEKEIRSICKQDSYQVRGMSPNDIAQELRLHLWNKIPLYDPRKSSLKTWAYKVFNNKIKDLKRNTFRNKRYIDYLIDETAYITGDEAKRNIA